MVAGSGGGGGVGVWEWDCEFLLVNQGTRESVGLGSYIVRSGWYGLPSQT